MAYLIARLGTGVPVDLQELLSRAVPGVQWRADPDFHPGIDDLELNDLARSIVVDNGPESGVSIRLKAGEGVRASGVFATMEHAGFVSVDRNEFGTGEDLDGLAAMADQLVMYSDDGRPSRERSRQALKTARANRIPFFCLPAVAEVHWFGERLVSWFGGDDVFASMPDGWAERTAFGQWRVVGMDPDCDVGGFQADRWSERERAVIEHLGREFFFDVESKHVPQTPPPPEVELAPFDRYLWRDEELVISSVDGRFGPPSCSCTLVG